MLRTVLARSLKSNHGRLFCTAALIGTFGAGCTDVCFGWFKLSRTDDDGLAVTRCADEQPDGSVENEAGMPEAGESGTSVPPSGPVVTSVTANGSGCPADGTATPTIASDGQSFTVAFTQLTVSVDENTRSDTKNCDLAIRVSVPEGMRYALESINLKGTGTIGEGASINVSSYYYFQGNSADRAEQQSTLPGPYDQAFDLTHVYSNSGPVSVCAVERNLNVALRITLGNGTPRTAGTATMNSAGDVAFRLVPCQ